jgi:hypothetical protein
MKTPMQELLKLESDLTRMFDSDERVAMAILEHIRNNKKAMLDKEEEVMVDFAYKCRNVMAADEFAITHWYNKTFKTKER